MAFVRTPLTPIRTAAVLICTRDRPQELTDCLASCARLVPQLNLKTVICVADNNAVPQEDEIRLVGAHLGLDLRYAYEAQRGYASVRNRALELALAAGADIAIFIDDDSTVHPRLVTAHVAAMERYGADAILGRIEGLSQKPVEGRRVSKAGTGNLSLRRWVFDPETGAGLRFDPRLNLLGFEDWEFSADLGRAGGVIYQSVEPISISRPTIEAMPNSEARPFLLRRAFAIMEGRNEIAATRIRHGLGAATAKVFRRFVPLLVRGLAGMAAAALAGLRNGADGRAKAEQARLRVAKSLAGFSGVWRPGFERPLARQGELKEVRLP